MWITPTGMSHTRGVTKICDFQEITCCIWKMLQDTHTQILRKVNIKSYVLLQMVTLPMTWGTLITPKHLYSHVLGLRSHLLNRWNLSLQI